MTAIQLNGTTDYAEVGLAAVNALPLSMAAWFLADITPNDVTILSMADTATSNHMARLQVSATAQLSIQTRMSSGTTRSATAAATITTGTWYHAGGYIASDVDYGIYLNGGGKVTGAIDAGTFVNGAYDNTTIGVTHRTGAPITFWPGRIGACAIWNVQLTDEEFASLAFMSPLLIRPSALTFFVPWPGRSNPSIDIVGGQSLAWTGTPSKGMSNYRMAHARGRRRIFLPASVTPPAGPFTYPSNVRLGATKFGVLGVSPTTPRLGKAP